MTTTQSFTLGLAINTLDSDASDIEVKAQSLKKIQVDVNISVIKQPLPSLQLEYSIKLPSQALAARLDWPDWQPQHVRFQDYLWEHTCLECFIQGITHNDDSRYIEINASPDGHYAFYEFHGYRQPDSMPPVPLIKRDDKGYANIVWTDSVWTDTDDTHPHLYQRSFTIALSQLPKSIFDKQTLTIKRINPCVILYFDDTPLYFACQHATAPDFHDQRYWLDFNPAS
ncbi:hypothetical protein [uncultured Psychrobacter sp.]|uniref:hypothetical protein n=1 Tax=unclassified Psychrobacter TaxID=196806 RepID=UPI00293D6A68|nr:hypothetical protein [uncultured Psychrobacter sp.]